MIAGPEAKASGRLMAEEKNRGRTTQSTIEEQQSNQSRTEENKNNRRMERNEERTRKEDYLYYPILGYLTILYIRTPHTLGAGGVFLFQSGNEF